MGLDEDEGRVFESAGFGGGGGGLLGEDRGSGSAAEEDVVHLVGVEVRDGGAAKSECNSIIIATSNKQQGDELMS